MSAPIRNLWFNTPSSVFLLDSTLEGVVWHQATISSRVFYHSDEPIRISYGSSAAPEALVDVMKLGDGYEQVATSGINPVRLKFNIQFNNRDRFIAAALGRFFLGDSVGGCYTRTPADWFYFKIPAPLVRAGETRRFRAENLNQTPSSFNTVTTTVTFTESFEP